VVHKVQTGPCSSSHTSADLKGKNPSCGGSDTRGGNVRGGERNEFFLEKLVKTTKTDTMKTVIISNRS
jgi:hypothetical protein